MTDPKPMTEGQRAYEERRAAKAGKSLDTWLEQKRKQRQAEAKQAAVPAAAAPKKPGLIRRLLDRAHKPL
ncbi:MAG: hypothetical protein JOZ05_13020 [Acetobacteraceae bacterium]|nr:hypothetical protein [Acetobacteraceae bacterium]